jgi:integrase
MVQRKNKRSANGGGTIKSRSDGRWEGQFTVGIDPGTGKVLRRSVYGKTQSECRKKMAVEVAAIDGGTYLDPDKITVRQWLNDWLETYIQPNRKPLTAASYRTHINSHLIPAFGTVRLQALTQEDVQRGMNKLARTLAPKTVNVVFGTLHSAMRKALALGKIGRDPCFGVELPQNPKQQVVSFENEQTAEFLQVIKTDRFRDVFIIALLTGMRESELLGLCWADVDLEDGLITVRRQLQQTKEKPGIFYIQPTKNGKERTIIPPQAVIKLLQDIKQRQTLARICCGRAWGVDTLRVLDGQQWKPFKEQLVFTDAFGKHLYQCTLRKHFKSAAASIGMPDAHFHGLRHTFAVASLQEGCDLKTLQSILGHATASFTLDVYGGVTKEMQRKNADKMQQFFEEVNKQA